MTAEPLYQLELLEDGRAGICLGGERLASLSEELTGPYCRALERIEDDRGRQIALRFLAIGIALAGRHP